MSLLLDALKKSEAQRRRGRLPDMQTADHATPSAVDGQRNGRRMLLVALPLVAALGSAGWWLMTTRQAPDNALTQPDRELARPVSAPLPEPTPPSLAGQAEPAVERPSGARQPTDDVREPATDVPRAEVSSIAQSGTAPPQPADVTAPSAESGQDAAAPAVEVSATPAGAAELRSPVTELPARQAADQSAEQSSRPSVENYIHPWELPQPLRAEFPALKMSVHFFGADPDQRFVLINAERRVEGDAVTDGVRLVEIIEQGAVVEFRGYRILLQ